MRKQKPPLVTTTIKQPKGACIEQQGNFDFRPTNLVVRDCIRLWEKTTEILQENESHEEKKQTVMENFILNSKFEIQSRNQTGEFILSMVFYF